MASGDYPVRASRNLPRQCSGGRATQVSRVTMGRLTGADAAGEGEVCHPGTRNDKCILGETERAPNAFPVASCQDARVARFVDSSGSARMAGPILGAFFAVVRVRSSAVRAWT